VRYPKTFLLEQALANLKGAERAQYVQSMFARIARRYDLMNRLMTAGQDAGWRREVIRRAALPPRGRLLDLGAGTGDLAFEALRQQPTCQPLAADFTIEMMRVGQSRARRLAAGSHSLGWAAADAQRLPFADETFDAVVSGFLLRNVGDLPGSLGEQRRVLKPGGRFVALDTTPPPRSPLAPLLRFHLHTLIPALGGLIAGNAAAYRYLPDSTEDFLEPEQLAARLLAAGFVQVGFHRRMLGTVAIHWARKPG
jgi:demethylmenaquinone methyltransferase/2-methoxy-6-polyprenyl-1,4-benzoquinol methylase